MSEDPLAIIVDTKAAIDKTVLVVRNVDVDVNAIIGIHPGLRVLRPDGQFSPRLGPSTEGDDETLLIFRAFPETLRVIGVKPIRVAHEQIMTDYQRCAPTVRVRSQGLGGATD